MALNVSTSMQALVLSMGLALAACSTTGSPSGDAGNSTALQQRITELEKRLAKSEVASSANSAGSASATNKSTNDLVEANVEFISSAAAKNMSTPPNAKPGECYALTSTNERVSQQYVAKDAGNDIQVSQAQYRNRTEKVLVKPAHEALECTEPQFEEIVEKVLVAPAVTKTEVVPAQYKTVNEKVVVSPAYTVWKKSSELTDEERANQLQTQTLGTGDVLCLIEMPAKYQEVSKQVLVSKATTREVQVSPAKYKDVKRYRLKQNAKAQRQQVAAEYETITIAEKVADAKINEVAVPPLYASFSTEKPNSGKPEWRQVLCQNNATESKIAEVQKALSAAGFKPGNTSGTMDQASYDALRQYQQKAGLPVDEGRYINVDTIRKLGLSEK